MLQFISHQPTVTRSLSSQLVEPTGKARPRSVCTTCSMFVVQLMQIFGDACETSATSMINYGSRKMKTKNISIEVDGHKFKPWPNTTSKHCESCGIGYGTYLNHGTKCRSYVDVREQSHKLVDKYLDAGGDPEMIIIGDYPMIARRLPHINPILSP